jgi:predicted phage terminase large subunit-like protein
MSNSLLASPDSNRLYETLLREELRRRAKGNLYAFARYAAPSSYCWNWHHALFYRHLDDFARGARRRVIVEAPPGHGKSEGCSRNLPAYLFGINPDCRVIACSYTQDLASEMNRDVQRIMDSPEYRSVFPGRSLGAENVRSLAGKPRRNTDIFDIPGHRGYYKSAGVGVGITGRRFDRGIIDDPIKDREEANSPAHRERVWRWFTSTFLKRAAKDAGILITCTRWHEDDLVGRIKRKMAAGEIEPYDILTLPGVATDHLHPDDPRHPGDALWPWFVNEEEYELRKKTEPRDFYALDQQDPRAEGDTEWAAALFPSSVWFDDWPTGLRHLVIGLDPSKGKDAKHGDYSALVCTARDSDGTLWVEADLARRNIDRIIADGIEFARRVRRETRVGEIEGFGIEADAFQDLLGRLLGPAAEKAGFPLRLYMVHTESVKKEVRIRRLTPLLTAGKIRFRNTPGTRLLVRQMQEFPTGDHDDGPDALEQAKRLGDRLLEGRHGSGR